MYKLYFELSKYEIDTIVHTDSFLINIDGSGLFYKIVISPLVKLFRKWSSKE